MLIFGWLLFFSLGGLDSLAGESPLAPGKVTWMINVHALQLLREQGDEAQKLVDAYFNNPNTYVMATVGQLSKVPSRSLPTLTFTSYANLKKAFNSGKIDPRVKAIIYDSENWQFTPPEEKTDPSKYYSLSAQLVHEHHLRFLATPATNLAKAIDPRFSGTRYDEFVKLGIARGAAKDADVYEIQAQGSEANPDLFTRFVSAASAQAKSANPQVTVLAGLSTNPTGHTVTADQLFGVVVKSIGTVSGYWMNIPGQSPYCPSCGTPHPAVAVELLRKMSDYHS